MGIAGSKSKLDDCSEHRAMKPLQDPNTAIAAPIRSASEPSLKLDSELVRRQQLRDIEKARELANRSESEAAGEEKGGGLWRQVGEQQEGHSGLGRRGGRPSSISDAAGMGMRTG